MERTVENCVFKALIKPVTAWGGALRPALFMLLLSALHSRGHDATDGLGSAHENTGPVSASAAAVRLVAQLDPFIGNNRYGDVWADGNYAYIGCFIDETVGIIDISDLAAPKLAGIYSGGFGGTFQDIQVKNGIGYFASYHPQNGSGVHVVDVSRPLQPVLLARITSGNRGFNSVHNVFVDGDILYQADNQTPVVKVFDVSKPSAPVFIREVRTSDAQVHDITVLQNRLYTSGMGGKTDIFDAANIRTRVPVSLGSFDTGAFSHSSWVNQAGTILASCSESGAGELRLYNISNPSSPVLLSRVTSQTLRVDAATPHNPVIVGDLLFVSWYQAGLQVFNIRNPANPLLIGAFDTFRGGTSEPGGLSANGVTFDGCWGVYPLHGLERVLLSDFDGGLFIVDATSLAAPDADNDFLPDAWEVQHGLDPAVPAAASHDSDGDGASDVNEFLSGTNPMDKNDAVRITGISRAGSEVSITFSSREGRMYRVERNSRAEQAGWALLRDEVPGRNGGTTVTHSSGLSSRHFYRVLARP